MFVILIPVPQSGKIIVICVVWIVWVCTSYRSCVLWKTPAGAFSKYSVCTPERAGRWPHPRQHHHLHHSTITPVKWVSFKSYFFLHLEDIVLNFVFLSMSFSLSR